MTQFLMSLANTRTVHKLKGRSLEKLILLTLDYTDNWIYVALSRVKTPKGFFLRKHCYIFKKVRGGINSEYIHDHLFTHHMMFLSSMRTGSTVLTHMLF